MSILADWPFGGLTPLSYDIIVADPPWRFDLRSDAGVTDKGAGGQYATMPLDEIKALPVSMLARTPATLLMWATPAMLPEQIDTLRAWGFRYVTEIVWDKRTVRGKQAMGTGYRVRNCHESILVGVIGSPPSSTRVRSLFQGRRRQHSRKPAEFWAAVENIQPGAERWCELFSRETTRLPNGIIVDPFGFETGKFDAGKPNGQAA